MRKNSYESGCVGLYLPSFPAEGAQPLVEQHMGDMEGRVWCLGNWGDFQAYSG
jgi:hypothetical protein